VPAWLVLALIITLVLALAFQLAARRFGWRVIGYWLFVFLGFIAGEIVAESVGLNWLRVGDLRLLPDLLGAAVALALLWWTGI